MGKAVPKNVKRRANDLLEAKPEWFETSFEHNKRKLSEANLPLTKKVRNRVAGFITRKRVQQENAKKAAEKRAARPKELQPARAPRARAPRAPAGEAAPKAEKAPAKPAAAE